MRWRILFSGVCLAFAAGCCPAQDTQARAEALVQRSRDMSDIRSTGAPPFHLKATFSFTGGNLEVVQGMYIEDWSSESQWRRETVIGGLKKVEIRSLDKRWVVFPDNFPRQAQRLPIVLTATPPSHLDADFGSVEEKTSNGVLALCAFSQKDSKKQMGAFCFEKKTGVLLEKNLIERRPHNIVPFACEYGDFAHFGERWFPHEVRCFEDRHKDVSVNVEELTLLPASDSREFDPPSGAAEIGVCGGKLDPPHMPTNLMQFPENVMASVPSGIDPHKIIWVYVWFVVDVKGFTRDVHTLHDVDKAAKSRVIERVRNWRYLPATCDGKAVPAEMIMELPYIPH